MDFGKSLCVLCRRPLAEASLVAYPSDCPTHYFHFECLTKHASSERRCPIDKIPFDKIICIDEAISPDYQEAEQNATSSNDKVKTGERNGGTNENMQNTNPLPPLADMTISSEEDSNKHAGHSPTTSDKKIMITKETVSGSGTLTGGDINAGNIRCEICKSTSPGERTSPDCCVHWFHRRCFDNYVGIHSVCPVRNCYREITTYTCSSGLTGRIEMRVESEYGNMTSAPEGFECYVCKQADLGKHRAIAKPCEHMFHRHCLTEFVRENKKCPACQSPTKLIKGCTGGDRNDMQFD